MSLTEDIIFADPVLKRVFFDPRRLAPLPGHDAIVNIALHAIAELKVPFMKAKTVEAAERLVAGYSFRGRYFHGIRHYYFLARRHSEGYYLDTIGDHVNDGCEHVALFEHKHSDPFFDIDYQARAAYRHRYTYRPTTPNKHRSRRARSL